MKGVLNGEPKNVEICFWLQRQLALALEKNENKFQIQGKANAVVEMLIKALKFEWKYLNPYLLSISTHLDNRKDKKGFLSIKSFL